MSTAYSGMFAPAEFSNPEWPFGFTEILHLLHRRGWTVLKVATGFVVLTAIALVLWPSRYSTTAIVMLDPRKNNITAGSQVLTDLPTDPASVQDQMEILTSRDLAAAVIDRLDLAKDREFNRTLAPFSMSLFAQPKDAAMERSAITDVFLNHLSADSQGLSTAVSVTFWARDPEKAARVTNALVDAYIRSQLAQKAEAAELTTHWLNTRIAELARQVEADDAAVQSYKAANGLNDSGQGTQSLVDQQLAVINNQLVQAEADLAQKQATYSHVEGLVRSGRASEVSQVVDSPLIVQLRQQQAEAIRDAAGLDTRYGPKHPKRLVAESGLRDLDSKIEQEAQRIAGSVANDAAVARAQVNSLEKSLSAVRDQSNTQNLARVKLKALEAGAMSTRSMYQAFVTRLRGAQDQEGVTLPDVRVISHASVPAQPSSPPRLLILVVSVPAGLLLGLFCALVVERASVSRPQLQAAAVAPMTVPVVALVPDAREPMAADQLIDAPSSAFSRALIGLGERLAAVPVASRPRTILVSGFDPRDAVASVAVGLARAFALLGYNVVLVDADLARCAAARLAGVTATGRGMLEVLRGSVPLSRAVVKDRNSPVLVLGNSPSTADARTAWESQGARALIAHLAHAAEFVVIHAPAQLEMVPLVSMAEGVLFVGSAGDAQSLGKTALAFAPATRHLGLVLAA